MFFRNVRAFCCQAVFKAFVASIVDYIMFIVVKYWIKRRGGRKAATINSTQIQSLLFCKLLNKGLENQVHLVVFVKGKLLLVF